MPALNVFAALVAALVWAAPAFGQIARILDAKGTSIVQRAGQPSRILGQGEQLDEKDVISVARDSYAILEFRDQTRITLRPNTVFRLDSYRDSASESMLFGLVRGGFRAVTGLIGKANPKAVRFTTATATMGIRGTEFDARLCEDDCAAEERARPAPPTRHGPVARVVEMNGIIAASRAGTGARLLVAGASIYEGDGIATGPRSYVVLAFRDGSRITVAGDSRLAILVYQFDEAKRAGHAVLNHVAGGARVQTGAIAKQGPEFYRFITPLGDVRPRGTGFDSFVNTVVGGVQDTRQAADDAKRQADADARKKADEAKRKADEAKRLAEEAAKRAAAAASDAGKGAQSSAPKSPPPSPPMDHDAVRDVASASIQMIPGIGPAASAASNAAPGAAQELDQAAAEARLKADQAAAAAKQKMEQLARDADTATRRNASRIDTAVNQMENAAPAAPSPLAMLNAAVDPLLLEMTALMTQLRNNPPTTEAAAQQAAARVTQLGNQLQAVINQAISAAGSTANSTEFRTAVGLAYTTLMHFNSVWSTSITTPAISLAGDAAWQSVSVLVQNALVTPYLSESLALVGLSDSDLRNVLLGGPLRAHTVIEAEVGDFLASQGSAAAQALFAAAQATADAVRQRAEQDAAVAKQKIDQAAAEGKRKADQAAAEAKLKADQAAAAAKQKSVAIGRSVTAGGSPKSAAEDSTAFIREVLRTVKERSDNFGNDVTANLDGNLVKWLIGPMTEAGITVPEELSMRAILTAILQAGRAASERLHVIVDARFGPEAWQLVTTLANNVQVLVRDGPRGFWMVVRDEMRARAGDITTVASQTLNDAAAEAKERADQAAEAVKRQSAEVTAARRSTDQEIAEAQKRAQQILAEIKVQMDSAPKPGEVATMADELAWASTLITVAFVRNMGDQIFAGGRDEQAGGGGVPTPSIPVVTVSALMLEIIAEGVADHLTRWAPVGVETAGNTSVPVATLSAMILTMIANRLVDGVETAGNASVPVATLSAMILTMIANRLVDQTEDWVSADARALAENRIRAIQALAEETIGARARRTEAGQQEAGQSKPGGRRQVLHTWDGVVEVGDPVNSVAVRKDQTISIAGLGSNPVFLREPPPDMIDSRAPRPDRVKVDPSLFGTDPKGIDAGLYVWVREGAISLDREGKTVDVPAGSAAVATSGRVGLLDTVPNFLRFDGTPRPVRAPGGAVVDSFRAPDGSVLGMCAVR